MDIEATQSRLDPELNMQSKDDHYQEFFEKKTHLKKQ